MSSDNKLKILFLADDREDYLADGILHGLHQLYYVEVTDYPKKQCLYTQSSTQAFNVRGGGFTLYGLLDDKNLKICRDHIQQKLEANWFDLVIISNIWRQWGLLLQWEELLKSSCPLAILDGDDDERFYPLTGSRIKKFGPTRWLKNLLERNTTVLFKREWTRATRTWPYNCQLYPIGFSIPYSKVLSSPSEKFKLFPTHIVDPEVCALANGKTNYAFKDESNYRSDLAASRFGITTKRGGWECLRHYEIAASATVPCFKDLTSKPASCAPHGLVDGVNCISYNTTQDLMEQINQLSMPVELAMREAALDWAKASSTKIRAIELLKAMKIDP